MVTEGEHRGGGAGQCGAGSDGAVRASDCDEAVHQLYHYLDGELTEERRHGDRRPPGRCGPCADAAGFEAELRSVIASRCRDRVPTPLIARIAAAIHEEARRVTTRHRPAGAAPVSR